MKQIEHIKSEVTAPPPRLTPLGAALVALAAALPGGLMIGFLSWLLL